MFGICSPNNFQCRMCSGGLPISRNTIPKSTTIVRSEQRLLSSMRERLNRDFEFQSLPLNISLSDISFRGRFRNRIPEMQTSRNISHVLFPFWSRSLSHRRSRPREICLICACNLLRRITMRTEESDISAIIGIASRASPFEIVPSRLVTHYVL